MWNIRKRGDDSKAFGLKNWVNECIYIVTIVYVKENQKLKCLRAHCMLTVWNEYVNKGGRPPCNLRAVALM